MQEQPYCFDKDWIQRLIAMLPKFIDICFTAGEVKYMIFNLKSAMELDEFVFEAMIFQHMYDRFSLVIPRFTEAWDAIEKCKDDDELIEVVKKYEGSAIIAMLVICVRNRTFDWRETCPIKN